MREREPSTSAVNGSKMVKCSIKGNINGPYQVWETDIWYFYLRVAVVLLFQTSSILPQNALRRDCNGKSIKIIEGHYLEVVVLLYVNISEKETCNRQMRPGMVQTSLFIYRD